MNKCINFLLVTTLFFISNTVLAASQPLTEGIDSSVAALDRALLAKDSVTLKGLLDENITYGHSNGWIETKRDVVNDLFNGKLTYKQISVTSKDIQENGGVAVVRMKADVDVIVSNTQVQLKLNILQVWKKKHRYWVLVARQSVKI